MTSHHAPHHASHQQTNIDPSSDYVPYQGLTISVSGVLPGQEFDLQLAAVDGSSVVYSPGKETSRASGISLIGTAGAAIPLNSIHITPQKINVVTASGAGGGTSVSFSMTLYLCASPDLTAFSLLSNAVSSGVSVNVSLGQGASQPVGSVATPFFWQA